MTGDRVRQQHGENEDCNRHARSLRTIVNDRETRMDLDSFFSVNKMQTTTRDSHAHRYTPRAVLHRRTSLHSALRQNSPNASLKGVKSITLASGAEPTLLGWVSDLPTLLG